MYAYTVLLFITMILLNLPQNVLDTDWKKLRHQH